MLKFNFVKQARSSLYYRQYRYSINFLQDHAQMLRKLDHSVIDRCIQYRNAHVGSRPQTWLLPVSEQQAKNLHETCDYLLAHVNQSHDHKRVICGRNITVYTNEPDQWQDIKLHCQGVIFYGYAREADVCLPVDAVALKRPRHQYRTYFRDYWSGRQEQLDNIRSFFMQRLHTFEPSPSFGEFLIGKRMWISGYNFVDHNEPNIELFINLACPGIVSKTLPIVTRDK